MRESEEGLVAVESATVPTIKRMLEWVYTNRVEGACVHVHLCEYRHACVSHPPHAHPPTHLSLHTHPYTYTLTFTSTHTYTYTQASRAAPRRR